MKSSEIRPSDYRKAEYPLEPLFLERWSARAMSGEAVAEKDLMTLFEAARWAPSPMNVQNWHYCYALKPSAEFDLFFSFLAAGNQEWCRQAGALIAAIDQTLNDDGKPVMSHRFNLGLSVENLLLQARAMNLVAHPMLGFNAENAAKGLNLPEGYEVAAMIAVGHFGEIENLSEKLQAREVPSDRKPLKDFVHRGTPSPKK
ncbi:MAG: nitroreductase family protein [Anaerolineaceae bacterium]|nr:nitroreductase family protein [Anaerolineaceae bacterium]